MSEFETRVELCFRLMRKRYRLNEVTFAYCRQCPIQFLDHDTAARKATRITRLIRKMVVNDNDAYKEARYRYALATLTTI